MLSIENIGYGTFDTIPGSKVLVPGMPGEWVAKKGVRFDCPKFYVQGTPEELEAFLDEWRWSCTESDVCTHLFALHVSRIIGQEFQLAVQFALVDWPREEEGPLLPLGWVARLTIDETIESLYKKHVLAAGEER